MLQLLHVAYSRLVTVDELVSRSCDVWPRLRVRRPIPTSDRRAIYYEVYFATTGSQHSEHTTYIEPLIPHSTMHLSRASLLLSPSGIALHP